MPEEVDSGDAETTDLVRLMRHFGVRALGLAAIAAPAGFTTVALALAVAGFVLVFAPVRR